MLKHAWSDLLVRPTAVRSRPIRLPDRSCGATSVVQWTCVPGSEDKVSEHCLTKLFVIAIDNLYHFLGYYKSQLKRTREEAESEARMLWNEVKKLRMMTEILAERMNRLEREERERHESTERRDRERLRGEEEAGVGLRKKEQGRRRESFKREITPDSHAYGELPGQKPSVEGRGTMMTW